MKTLHAFTQFVVLLSLPLLLGGCGGDKKEPVAEVEEENYLDGINSGDRIYYRYKGVDYEKTVGLEDNDDDFPNLVWFVSKEELKFQDLITFRSMENTKKVTEGEWSSAIILWIKKHPDQLQMPPLTE